MGRKRKEYMEREKNTDHRKQVEIYSLNQIEEMKNINYRRWRWDDKFRKISRASYQPFLNAY